MIRAPIPVNEVQRLQALRALKILDSPPELSFDRMATMAARLFAPPYAS